MRTIKGYAEYPDVRQEKCDWCLIAAVTSVVQFFSRPDWTQTDTNLQFTLDDLPVSFAGVAALFNKSRTDLNLRGEVREGSPDEIVEAAKARVDEHRLTLLSLTSGLNAHIVVVLGYDLDELIPDFSGVLCWKRRWGRAVA